MRFALNTASTSFRRLPLVLALASLAATPPAMADLLTADVLHTVEGTGLSLTFDPIANDRHTGGIPFEVSAVENLNCPGTVTLDPTLGLVTWNANQAPSSNCSIRYTASAEDGSSRDGYIVLSSTGGQPPVVATHLDERRADYLGAFLDHVFDTLHPPGEWQENPPGSGCVDAIGVGDSVGNASGNRGQRRYWGLILALLGADEMGLDVLSRLPFAQYDAVETARRLMRYQHCLNPGELDPPPPSQLTPLQIGIRNTAMRIFLLYEDVLFPPGSSADQDLYDTLHGRMTEHAGLRVCTYEDNDEHFPGGCSGPTQNASCHTGTENQCAVANSFRALSAQVAGTPASDARVLERNAELVRFLRHATEFGFQEWNSGYQEWTWVSILNLAEFSDDPLVQQYARMAIDYNLAILSSQSDPAGGIASGSVRTYPWNLYDEPIWQTLASQFLFTGRDLAPASLSESAVEFAVSNYSPLVSVERLFDRAETTPEQTRTAQRGYIRGRSKTYTYQNYRGSTYSLAAHPRQQINSYGDYEIVVAYAKSSRSAASHGVAIGFDPDIPATGTLAATHRAETSRQARRSFLHGNALIYTEGGLGCQPDANGACSTAYQPPRFYLTPDFAVDTTTDADWAFATNQMSSSDPEATYLAWGCRYGSAAVDFGSSPDGPTGTFLKSSYVPPAGSESLGESCVIEAGSASEFGSYGAFVADIRSRPGLVGGANNLSYTLWNGDLIEYRRQDPGGYTFLVTTGGSTQDMTPDENTWPRVEADGFSFSGSGTSRVFSLSIEGETTHFHLGTGQISGTSGGTLRLASDFVFGPDGDDPPPPPGLSATKIDTFENDVDGDGVVEPGDRVRYTIRIENSGGSTATGVSLSDKLPSHTSLVSGSITTTQGNVTQLTPDVVVELGDLAAGASAEVGLVIELLGTLPADRTEIENQGSVFADNAPSVVTDDPDIPGSSNKTVTPVGAEPQCLADPADDRLDLDPTYQVPWGGYIQIPGHVLTANDLPAGALSDPQIASQGAGSVMAYQDLTGDWIVQYEAPTVHQPTDTFEYSVYADGDDPSCAVTATVTVAIDPPPPCDVVANDDPNLTVNWGSSLFILTNTLTANDPATGELGDIAIERQPAGSLRFTGSAPPSYEYEPPAVYQPTDSFDYSVALLTDPTCRSTATATITIVPPPAVVPDFGFVCDEAKVCQFQDLTTGLIGGETVSWSFGDGTPPVSGSGDKTHTYSHAGTYAVTLTVVDSIGRTTTKTHYLMIEADLITVLLTTGVI